MKWSYEKLMEKIDKIIFDYIEDKISFDEKEARENEAYQKSGWTWNEMMDEIERKMDARKS